MTDTEMIDWLEDFINSRGPLVLHDGNATTYGYPGLGLRPGYLNRSLREAISAAAQKGNADAQKL
jgi:hypothetical protein